MTREIPLFVQILIKWKMKEGVNCRAVLMFSDSWKFGGISQISMGLPEIFGPTSMQFRLGTCANCGSTNRQQSEAEAVISNVTHETYKNLHKVISCQCTQGNDCTGTNWPWTSLLAYCKPNWEQKLQKKTMKNRTKICYIPKWAQKPIQNMAIATFHTFCSKLWPTRVQSTMHGWANFANWWQTRQLLGLDRLCHKTCPNAQILAWHRWDDRFRPESQFLK